MVRSVTPALESPGGFFLPHTPRLSTVFAGAPQVCGSSLFHLTPSVPLAFPLLQPRSPAMSHRQAHSASHQAHTYTVPSAWNNQMFLPGLSLRSGFYSSIPCSEKSSLATLPNTVPLTLLFPTLAVLLHGTSHRNNDMLI